MLSTNALDDVMGDFLLRFNISQAAVEISDDQRILWRHSKFESDTFPIYSITKSFIGTLILLGAQEGRYLLRDPLSTFFAKQEIPKWLEEASVMDLLTHRSGLGDYYYAKEYNELLKLRPRTSPSERELKEMAFKQGPQGSIEKKFFYSNIGYLLLVELLQKSYSLSFADLVTKKIILPLGLTQTSVLSTQKEFSVLVPGFSKIWSDDPLDVRDTYSPDWVSHRVLASSNRDLNEFFKGVFTHRLVNEEFLKLIRAPLKVEFDHPWISASYGPGFLGDAHSKFGSVLGHNGGGPGYTTSSMCVEKEGFPRYYLSACINQDYGDIAENLAFSLISAIDGTRAQYRL